MKTILILALLFPTMVYGKGFKSWKGKEPVIGPNKQTVVVQTKDGAKTKVYPIGDYVFGEYNKAVEAMILGAGEIASSLENCDEVCFSKAMVLEQQAKQERETNREQPLTNSLEALKQSYFTGEHGDIVQETKHYAASIKGPNANKKQGAVVFAGVVSDGWNDPVAQNKIPEVAEAWAEESQVNDDGSTVYATMGVFGDSIEKAEQREEDIETYCTAPAA